MPIDLDIAPKSKSELKRQAEAVERLVLDLIALSPAQLSELPCSEELRQEILEAQRTSEHGARRRAVKYVAKLLRATDRTDVTAFLDAEKGLRLKEAQEFRSLERLRDWICGDESGEALEETSRLFPSLQVQELAELVERYRRTGLGRFSREIFRRLKAASNKKGYEEKGRRGA